MWLCTSTSTYICISSPTSTKQHHYYLLSTIYYNRNRPKLAPGYHPDFKNIQLRVAGRQAFEFEVSVDDERLTEFARAD